MSKINILDPTLNGDRFDLRKKENFDPNMKTCGTIKSV